MDLFQYDDTFLWVTPFSKVIFRACELNWLPWRSGYRPFRESPCPDQLASLNLLLSLIVGRDHQVIIWIHVLKGWRFALDGGRFAIHTGDLQHPAGVVFQQIPRERFPSSSHADHDVFVVQHLKWKESKRVKFQAFLQYLESTFSSKCGYCVPSVLFFMPGFLSARGRTASDLANRLWKRLRLCHARGSRVHIPEARLARLCEWVCVQSLDWFNVSGGASLSDTWYSITGPSLPPVPAAASDKCFYSPHQGIRLGPGT